MSDPSEPPSAPGPDVGQPVAGQTTASPAARPYAGIAESNEQDDVYVRDRNTRQERFLIGEQGKAPDLKLEADSPEARKAMIELEERIKKVERELRSAATINNTYIQGVSTLIQNAHGAIGIDQRQASEDRGGGQTAGGQSSEVRPWPLDELCRIQPVPDLALRLALLTLSRAPLSLIEQGADRLAVLLQPREDEAREPLAAASSSKVILSSMRCRILDEPTARGAEPGPRRIGFEKDANEVEALWRTWTEFRLNRPWKPVFTRWLTGAGRSRRADLASAAGRAAGLLAVLDLHYFSGEVLEKWRRSANPNALGVALAVIAAEGRTEHSKWVEKTLRDLSLSKDEEDHWLVGEIVTGPFGLARPDLAVNVIGNLLRSETSSGFELALLLASAWCYQDIRNDRITPKQVLSEICEITTDDEDLNNARDWMFLWFTLSIEKNRLTHVRFLELLGGSPEAAGPVAVLLAKIIPRQPKGAEALNMLSSMVREAKSDKAATGLNALESALLPALDVRYRAYLEKKWPCGGGARGG